MDKDTLIVTIGKTNYKVTSQISINDGPYVPLSSLTPEQKAKVDQEVGRRISRAVERCYEQHPEDRERIIKALLDAGAQVEWLIKRINGHRCRIDYKDGQPCEPVWLE